MPRKTSWFVGVHVAEILTNLGHSMRTDPEDLHIRATDRNLSKEEL